MSRILFLLVLMFNTAAFAAVPDDVQEKIRQQFAQMKTQAAGSLTTEGDVQIIGDKIIYPAMKIMVPDKLSSWSIPSMTLTFTGTAQGGKIPFTLAVPSNFRQTHINGRALRSVSISGADVKGDWSQTQNTIERLDAKLASITWNDMVDATSTSAQDIAVQAKTQFQQGDKVNVLLHAQTKKFTRTPNGGIASSLMPTQSSLTGQIKALPKALVMFGALVPIPGLQSTLAQMGTQFDIDEVNAVMANGAKVKGNGFFKAAATGSQLPASGRMNIEMQNLQEVLTSLQQGFSSGTGNRGEAAQSMVMLMMLQGIGKSVGQTTRYTVDLTPEGQIILNGQDVTAMFVGSNSLLKFFQPKAAAEPTPTMPAMPVPVVKDEGNI